MYVRTNHVQFLVPFPTYSVVSVFFCNTVIFQNFIAGLKLTSCGTPLQAKYVTHIVQLLPDTAYRATEFHKVRIF